jgi:hypothetical protein
VSWPLVGDLQKRGNAELHRQLRAERFEVHWPQIIDATIAAEVINQSLARAVVIPIAQLGQFAGCDLVAFGFKKQIGQRLQRAGVGFIGLSGRSEPRKDAGPFTFESL